MPRIAWLPVALAVFAMGCSRPNASPDGPTLTAELTSVPGMAKYALAQPINVGNVTIVPVVSKEGQQPGGPEYATLAEAKKHAWIEIIEQPGDEEVNVLQVHNVGPKPILLLSGDLLLGGKQDRVVAKDTIVAPGETQKVPVYCVEPGRWSGESNHFSYGETTVPLSVKKEAAFGNQESVWSSVGGFNGSVGVESGRTTVQEGLKQKEVQAQIDANLDRVRARLGKNVVGLMFLVDSEVKTLEIFGSNRLFSASQDSLLKGALAQAAAGKNAAPSSAIDLAACAKFMAEAMQSNRVVESRDADSVAARRASANTRGREIHFDDFKGNSGGAAAEAPASGLIHGTYTKQ